MNRCAFVTGGAVGIGRGIALTLAQNGYDVAIHYHGSEAAAIEVQAQINALGSHCELFCADTARPEEVRAMFAAYRAAYPRLDLFIANAGVTKVKPFLEMDEGTFDLINGVDFKGTYFCVQSACALMRNWSLRGSVVIIASNNAFMKTPGASVYGSVKMALVKLTQHAAMEVARYGIRVNCIAPGWTETTQAGMPEKEKTFYQIPMKRWCTPSEIGQAALFLSGQWAQSITGECLMMDGGATLQTRPPEQYGL